MTTFPTITTALHGHTRENPYLVADYPYSFTLRCQMRVWLEVHPKHGTRLARQTSNPKRGDIWNKPKTSTYALLAGGMYLDEQGHVQWYGLNVYGGADETAWFLGHWPEHRDAVAPWIVAKVRHCRAREKANEQGLSGVSINGEPVPLAEGEAERNMVELREWEALLVKYEITMPRTRTVGEMRAELAKAVREGDVATARPILDRLRSRGLPQCNPPVRPFSRGDLLSFVRDGGLDIDVAAFDAFLAEIDAADSAAQ